MFINGRHRLAWPTLISEVRRDIIVQPLPHMPIIKDLVVDLSSFFEKYEIVKPYVVPTKPPPEKEWIQSPKDRSRINDSTDCIMCAACYSSCHSVWTGKKYLGPRRYCRRTGSRPTHVTAYFKIASKCSDLKTVCGVVIPYSTVPKRALRA